MRESAKRFAALFLLIPCFSFGQARFTYQGYLRSAAQPANGTFDLEFVLTDSEIGGDALGTNLVTDQSISNGLFTVSLDFEAKAFDGQARWLELEVRPSGTSEFVRLVPRQPINPAPYALSAGTAAVSGAASNLLGTISIDQLPKDLPPFITNTVVVTNYVSSFTNSPAPILFGNSRNALMSWSNSPFCPTPLVIPSVSYSNLLVGVVNPFYGSQLPLSTPGGSIGLPDRNGLFWKSGAQIWDWVDHGSSCSTPLNELQIMSGYRGAITCNNSLYSKGLHGIWGGYQMGNSYGSHDSFWFQYNWTHGSIGLGKSKAVYFITKASTNGIYDQDGAVTIRARAVGYDSERSVLDFYSGYMDADNAGGGNGTYVGGMLTNGWKFPLRIVESSQSAFSGSTYVLDFNGPRVCVLTVSGDLSLQTTNASTDTADAESKCLIVRGGGIARNLSFPSGWTWLGPQVPASPPNLLPAEQLMKVQIDVVAGQVFASALFGADPIVWDPVAKEFLERASITAQPERLAVNNLVIGLKEKGLWPKIYAFYPFVGGTGQSHSFNLVADTYRIAWSASGVTHDETGTTGDGISGFGDTGFRPAAAGVNQDSFALYGYVRTTNLVDLSYIFGTTESAASAAIGKSNGIWFNRGMNDTEAGTLSLPLAPGNLILSRYGAGAKFLALEGKLAQNTIQSTGTTTSSILVLCRNLGGTASNFAAVNLGAFGIFKGLTTTEFTQLCSVMDRFETDLKRKVAPQ